MPPPQHPSRCRSNARVVDMSEFSLCEPRPGVLALSGELTISTAVELKPLLIAALRQQTRLEVDLLNVTRLDTAGVQLLLLLHREATRTGTCLSWLGYSLAVEEVLELLDLAYLLGSPSAVVWT
jgi:anti-sigma B factor antagonist